MNIIHVIRYDLYYLPHQIGFTIGVHERSQVKFELRVEKETMISTSRRCYNCHRYINA